MDTAVKSVLPEANLVSDLTGRFGGVRDQGPRPTCMAFAASDTHAAVRPGWEPLCIEYAFYNAVRRDPPGTLGVRPAAMLTALAEDGQPREEIWPYNPNDKSDPLTRRPPEDLGNLYRRGGEERGPTFENLVDSLAVGRPTIVILCPTAAFYGAASGLVDVPTPDPEPPDFAAGHAVVAVAAAEQRGRRFVLLRNSWGERWGVGGLAWASERYLHPRLISLAQLDEDDSREANGL